MKIPYVVNSPATEHNKMKTSQKHPTRQYALGTIRKFQYQQAKS
jgi:hypothetical protein